MFNLPCFLRSSGCACKVIEMCRCMYGVTRNAYKENKYKTDSGGVKPLTHFYACLQCYRVNFRPTFIRPNLLRTYYVYIYIYTGSVVFSICGICEFMTAWIPYFLIASGVEEITSVSKVPGGRNGGGGGDDDDGGGSHSTDRRPGRSETWHYFYEAFSFSTAKNSINTRNGGKKKIVFESIVIYSYFYYII